MADPSLHKILRNDFATFLQAVAAAVFFCLALFLVLFPLEARPDVRGALSGYGPMLLCFGIALIAAGLLVKRIGRLKRILTLGPRVQALIIDLGFYRDRGRIAFTFTHQGEEVTARELVIKNEETRALAIGDRVEAAVDLEKPSRSFLVPLFFQ